MIDTQIIYVASNMTSFRGVRLPAHRLVRCATSYRDLSGPQNQRLARKIEQCLVD